MHTTKKALVASTVSLLSLALVSTGIAASSRPSASARHAAVRNCIQQHVLNRTTRRVNSAALRACLKAARTGTTASASSTSMSGMSSSRSSMSGMSSSHSMSSMSGMSSSRSSMSMSSMSGMSSSMSISSRSASSTSAPMQASVTIQNFAYMPSTVTVKKGGQVTWTNNDSAPHTATRHTSGGPTTGKLDQGESDTETFNKTGTFSYYCAFHPDMEGTVIVTE